MRNFMTLSALGCVAALLAGCLAERAPAADKFYMVVFASQTEPSRPRTAHTFATFVKATEATKDGGSRMESHTISWLPESLNIVLVRLNPEPGKNLDLDATKKWAQAMNARITGWGPFEIKKGLFDSAGAQIERLKSGKLSYKAIDGRLRGGAVANCIHAVSDLDTDHGPLATGTAFGDAASVLVVRHLERWIINSDKTYPKIAAQLNLADDEVRFERFAKPAPPQPKDAPARP